MKVYKVNLHKVEIPGLEEIGVFNSMEKVEKIILEKYPTFTTDPTDTSNMKIYFDETLKGVFITVEEWEVQ